MYYYVREASSGCGLVIYVMFPIVVTRLSTMSQGAVNRLVKLTTRRELACVLGDRINGRSGQNVGGLNRQPV